MPGQEMPILRAFLALSMSGDNQMTILFYFWRVCQVFCVSFNKIFWGGSPPHSYIAKLLKINSLKRSL